MSDSTAGAKVNAKVDSAKDSTKDAVSSAADSAAAKAKEAKEAAEAKLPLDVKISATRAELEETLDAIGDKLNVPKRLGHLGSKASDAYHVNPTPFIVGAAAGVISIVGAVVLRVRGKD